MTLVLKVNCRACNRECGDYRHLMDETIIDNESTTLAALLSYCTSLELFGDNDDYNMPEHICNSCVEHLLQCYLFKEMVLQTDRELRQHIKQQHIQQFCQASERQKQYLDDEADAFVEQDIDVDGMEDEMTPKQKIHVAKWASVVTEVTSNLECEQYNQQSNQQCQQQQRHQQQQQPQQQHQQQQQQPQQQQEQQKEHQHQQQQQQQQQHQQHQQEQQYLEQQHLQLDQQQPQQQQQQQQHNQQQQQKPQEESLHDDEQDEENAVGDEENEEEEEEEEIDNVDEVEQQIGAEYEMEEWLDIDDVVEEVVSPEAIELLTNENSLLDEVKSERLTDNEVINDCDINGIDSTLDDDIVVRDEGDEAYDDIDEEEFMPSHNDNKENSRTNIDIVQATSNTEEEYELITSDDHVNINSTNNTNDTERKIIKRASLKGGQVTLADLICKYCGKQFDKMCRLREHTYMHTGEKPHVCNICGKRSRTKTHHNVHMLTHSDHKRYKCATCGQLYRTSNSLRVHERKHTDIRPYACPMCEKTYHTAEQRKLHVMLHTGERPHSCEKCGKAYRESYSLRLHMQTHEEQKPYQCEICGKGLTQMSGYKRHMLLHTGEYPHKCDVCGRAFRISSNLLAHKRLHLDVLPYQCTQCHKGFTTTTRLKRHILQHERIKEPKEDVFRPRRQRTTTTYVEHKVSRSKVVEIL